MMRLETITRDTPEKGYRAKRGHEILRLYPSLKSITFYRRGDGDRPRPSMGSAIYILAKQGRHFLGKSKEVRVHRFDVERSKEMLASGECCVRHRLSGGQDGHICEGAAVYILGEEESVSGPQEAA